MFREGCPLLSPLSRGSMKAKSRKCVPAFEVENRDELQSARMCYFVRANVCQVSRGGVFFEALHLLFWSSSFFRASIHCVRANGHFFCVGDSCLATYFVFRPAFTSRVQSNVIFLRLPRATIGLIRSVRGVFFVLNYRLLVAGRTWTSLCSRDSVQVVRTS